MHGISSLPFLCASLVVFWLWLGLASYQRGQISKAGLFSIVAWIASLAAWGVASAHWALSGAYTLPRFLALLPGLWWPMIPTLITVVLLVLPSFRRALLSIAYQNSRALVLVHALRIAAIGGVLKGFYGLLPASFALPVGIPDLLFGLSALTLAMRWPVGGWSTRTLIAWNVIGISVIMPAPLLMQLGLPGMFHVFTTAPDARVLFEYPMVLAPTLVVPIFITMNAIHAAALRIHSVPSKAAVD